MTTLIISYAEIKDIMNMVKFIGQFGLLRMKQKKQKADFLTSY